MCKEIRNQTKKILHCKTVTISPSFVAMRGSCVESKLFYRFLEPQQAPNRYRMLLSWYHQFNFCKLLPDLNFLRYLTE
jgi:hypothetical protein